MANVKLFPYQQEAVDKLRNGSMEGKDDRL